MTHEATDNETAPAGAGRALSNPDVVVCPELAGGGVRDDGHDPADLGGSAPAVGGMLAAFGSATAVHGPYAEELSNRPFSIAMQGMVPLEIWRLNEAGGPGEADWDLISAMRRRKLGASPRPEVGDTEWQTSEDSRTGPDGEGNDPELDAIIVAGSDGKCSRKMHKELGRQISDYARALAIMAFCPGGVVFAGIRYQARPGEWEAAAAAGAGAAGGEA